MARQCTSLKQFVVVTADMVNARYELQVQCIQTYQIGSFN